MAVDIWPETARYAAPGVETKILDVSRDLASLGTSSFDAVLASNILEHFEPGVASSVVEDVARLLKPGGRLLIVQPNFRFAAKQYFDDYTHRSVFTDVSLPNLLRAHGFRIDHVQPRFLPYSMRDSRLPIRSDGGTSGVDTRVPSASGTRSRGACAPATGSLCRQDV